MERAIELFEEIIQKKQQAIEEFIASYASEELFLDFKQSDGHGEGTKLADHDRNNFAKAISGFGNSEGGVIVWGVDCRTDSTGSDVAQCIKPIKNPARFVSWLQSAVSTSTIPPHHEVEIRAIESKPNEGFVIALIPKSNSAPHQVIVKGQNQGRYFIRAGSSFMNTPHDVLAGLFGRRPSPDIRLLFMAPQLMYEGDHLSGYITLVLRNKGRSSAKNLFINVLLNTPGSRSKLSVTTAEGLIWTSRSILSNQVNSAVTGFEVRIPPESYAMPYHLAFLLNPPFADNFRVHISYGADGTPTKEFSLSNDRLEMERIYAIYLEKVKNKTMAPGEEALFVQQFFKISEIVKL